MLQVAQPPGERESTATPTPSLDARVPSETALGYLNVTQSASGSSSRLPQLSRSEAQLEPATPPPQPVATRIPSAQLTAPLLASQSPVIPDGRDDEPPLPPRPVVR